MERDVSLTGPGSGLDETLNASERARREQARREQARPLLISLHSILFTPHPVSDFGLVRLAGKTALPEHEILTSMSGTLKIEARRREGRGLRRGEEEAMRA